MVPNPLDMILAQAMAIKQQADALLLLVQSMVPTSPQASEGPTGEPRAGAQERAAQRANRTFDDDGQREVIGSVSAPAPDSDGNLRPVSTSLPR